MVTRIFPEADGPPRAADRPVEELERVAGSLALDFANTVGGTRRDPKEYLTDYGALVRWSAATGAIDGRLAGALRERALERREEAARAYGNALELREAIFRIFDAVATGGIPSGPDLASLNERLGSAMRALHVVSEGDGFDWRAESEPDDLETMLDPIVRDAAELLVSSDLDRIKQCGGENCAWLFVDASRNRSRRWCDMADCGNRAKQRRHYRRKQRGM